MTIPFWESAPELYGSLSLGKHTLRGIADIRIERGRKRDDKSAPGKNGTKLGSKGFEAAKVAIIFHVLSHEPGPASLRWDEATAILADLEDKRRAETALAISHPFCHFRGVSSVVVDRIVGPTVIEKSGLFSVTLECTEYVTPAAAKKGGKGGAGAGSSAAGGQAFPATVSDFDAQGKATGVLRDAQVTEASVGVFRDASTGKRVQLLSVNTSDGKTPREAVADHDRRTAEIQNAYSNPDSGVGGDIAFIEDEDGAKFDRQEKAVTADERPTAAKTEAKDLEP